MELLEGTLALKSTQVVELKRFHQYLTSHTNVCVDITISQLLLSWKVCKTYVSYLERTNDFRGRRTTEKRKHR